MTTIQEGAFINQTPVVRMENEFLQVDIAPTVGGKIVNIVEKASGYQFLWHNPQLKLKSYPAGTEYDPNFYGAMDELLPNDIPETVNGLASPDHGELWTLAFDHHHEQDSLVLSGVLPLCGLAYERRISLRPDSPHLDLDYRIQNPTNEQRVFLWKLHAALNIEPGDQIVCPARTAKAVDLEWSRWSSLEPFNWPHVDGQRADKIPPSGDMVDFLFLYDLEAGQMAWQSAKRGLTFAISFNLKVFPYAWYFASYGGFDGHYTAILEPCTTMPLSVNEAAKLGQCSVLQAGKKLETRVTLYAGTA